MMRTKNLIPAALVMLLAIGASTALADADFEGTSTGDAIPGTDAVPFSAWEGTLYCQTTPYYFDGYWGFDQDNWIYADLSLDGQTGVYTIIDNGDNE